jgi:hypothetical protein
MMMSWYQTQIVEMRQKLMVCETSVQQTTKKQVSADILNDPSVIRETREVTTRSSSLRIAGHDTQ